MIKRLAISFGLALLLGGGANMATLTSASAASLKAYSSTSLADVLKQTSLVEEVRDRRRARRHRDARRWRRRSHGPRYRSRRRGYRHFRGGYWYASPFWLDIVPAPRYYGYGNAHVNWCLRQFRSYNPRTNRYLGYDGRYHRCISPYS